MAKTNRKTVDTVFILLGLAMTVVLVIVGGLAGYAAHFAKDTVRTELASQKIYFPDKLDPAKYPGLQKYVGQQVDTGPKAKAYANEYIGVHLNKIANGQTYSEVSAAQMKDPTNVQLQLQKQTLFQGETLRGLLLGDGYAYWTFGQIAEYASIVSFAGAAVMALLVLLGLRHLQRVR